MGGFRDFIKDVRRRRVLANSALYIVAAWVTIQVADLAIDAGILRLPLSTVFVAAFLGFPVALIVSWYFDITRHGLVRTPPVDADATFDTSLQKRDYLLLATLAAIWFVANVVVYIPAPTDKSVAILPFENIGHDPNNALFGFGLRVDLQTQLQNIRDLKVIARESTDKVDSDMLLPEISRELGAAYIVKGSVERVLNQMRISVALIDAENDVQTWAANFDRELSADNWFDIRNEISGRIADTLQAELSPAEQETLQAVPTESLAALQAYHRGIARMAERTTEGLDDAVESFQAAVELDPEFALAWVGLADSVYLRFNFRGLSEDEGIAEAQAAIDKALLLDDQLGEAYVTLGLLQDYQDEPDAAEASFRRAVELNPNYAYGQQRYGDFLANDGQNEDGLVYQRQALELDPYSAPVHLNIGLNLRSLGRFDEALAAFKSAIESDPFLPGAYERIGDIYHSVYGQLDQAVAWQRKGVALDLEDPFGPVYLGLIYLDLGDTDEAERWFNRARDVSPPGFPLPRAALEPLYMRRGDADKAIDIGRETFEIMPMVTYTLAHLRNHELQAGRFAEARALYERIYSKLLTEDEPAIHRGNYQVAIDLALVLSRSGEQERADLLLDRALDFIATIPRLGKNGYGISDALIYAQQGNSEMALSALRQAIDQGWRTYWWYYLEHDLNLESLRGEPEFQAMVDEVTEDMAVQLESVREMEAGGELEVIPEID